MAITDPVYCTREEVMDATDFRASTLRIPMIDSAILGGSRDVDSLCNRQFYPIDKTVSFDYPNSQHAYPWRLWLEREELADTTVNVPVVKSGGNVISASQCLWGPWDDEAPPFTRLELSRAGSASFGQGTTPQQDITIQGTFGYWIKTEARGTLVGNILSNATTLVCADGSINSGIGVGDILLADSERMIVSNKGTVTSNQTTQSGCTTQNAADLILGVTDGTKYFVGEQLLIDAERMLVEDIAGNTLIVKRAWGGSTLATHTLGATIYVYRNLTVQRASLGTTAASHNSGITLYRFVFPGPVREMALAESINNVQQKTSGYARTVGSADNVRNASGNGLQDIRDRVYEGYARRMRSAVI